MIIRGWAPFNGQGLVVGWIFESHHDAKGFALCELDRLRKLNGVVAGIRLAATLPLEHTRAGFRLARGDAGINADGIFGVGIGGIEAHRFELFVACRGKYVGSGCNVLIVTVGIGRKGPTVGIVLVVAGIVIGTFQKVSIARNQTLVLVGNPEIAVRRTLSPAITPPISRISI